MAREIRSKKRLVVSAHNLPNELQAELTIKYPDGFNEYMIRIEKGFNDFFYAVSLETDEISYLVKVDVKIDAKLNDDDKEYYDTDEIEGADEIIDITDDSDDE